MSNTKKLSRFHLVSGSDWSLFKQVVPGYSGEKWDEKWVETEVHKMLRIQGGIFVNDIFMPLWNITNGLLFLAGSYGSSKTTYAITRLLVKCIENDYFKCIYGRHEMKAARQIHKNIIREIKRNNWQDLFEYSEKPTGTTEILCKANGNMFELFGCDDEESIKGIDNATDVFIDEVNQITFESFSMLFSRLRTPGCELQLTCCFNNINVMPKHWLLKIIYPEVNESGDDNTLYSDEDLLVIEAMRKARTVKHHSVYTDNKMLNPDEYLQKLIIQAKGDQDKIDGYCSGSWGIELNAQPFYKNFKRKVHVGHCEYKAALALWISWDENVNPYLPVSIWQVSGLDAYCIDEIAGENPNNTLRWVCGQIYKRYGPDTKIHINGMLICGDATSRKEDVKEEKGKDFFVKAKEHLKYFRPRLRVSTRNPNVGLRRDFINDVLGENIYGLSITISPTCKHMIADLQNTAEDPDGTHKDKTKVKVNGIAGVQRWGHFTDTLDYFYCEAFMKYYLLYQNAGKIYTWHEMPRVAHCQL